MREFATLADMQALTGQELAVSDWVEITQERVNLFADATDDHQWIHVDLERCARESPFGGPVAHGFLTLSLISGLFERALRMVDAKMVVNYGLNKVRFPAPVPVGSRVRARLTLQQVEPIDGGAQLEWSVVVEREGGTKPVCVAELLIRRYA
ncbi:MaoC family dehydratase [Massilia antarctica]|uniref:MaoC family dehydratase n=1 Tax=Massilia antarctica TaxID=2765360 RepID=UPI0006BB8678|nr:MaoC family dehydratase [Massilia sp. H27-R4]MCY0910450.1 MaoC family dehydratase [Massilia sp. H27-R4]CUI09202.1 Acyl dehydratase [Janthinobacterium sp. CG23_2]CUU32988.1 Acyl dehydratase [Janthinobacterium sp. CG23_2]